MQFETVVIGAGVVGLAVARSLALTGREVMVIERSTSIGSGTSSRNSEVIHSGIYYRPASNKARLCVVGRKMLSEYCASRSIPFRQTGKLIVATAQSELATLERYFELARLNGVEGVTWCSTEQTNQMEPEVRCVQALHVPCTGIVDSHALMTSLWADLQSAGGNVVFRSEVVSGQRLADGQFRLVVDGSDEYLDCRELVNAAGLSAPDLAGRLAYCGSNLPHAYFARGHYFRLSGPSPFSRLIYPIADSDGLGIHVTLNLAGAARFGPDVEWTDRVDYSFDESRRERFADAIRRYYPRLDAGRLIPDYVGVRPKIAPANGTTQDFRIDDPSTHGIPGLLHLFGIESPGLTAALAIGEDAVRKLRA